MYPTLMDELHDHALTCEALRALTNALAEVQSKYDELILNVISKNANETRHQTALRYIRAGGGIWGHHDDLRLAHRRLGPFAALLAAIIGLLK